MANLITTKLAGDMVGDLSRYEKKIKDTVLFAGVAAMAKVIYDEVKANTSGLKDAKKFPGVKTGTLHDSIYRVFSPEKSKDGAKLYRISWNKKTAPHGNLVEFGHWTKTVGKYGPLRPVWVPAHPFLRPAFDHIGAAITAGQESMASKLGEIKS